MDPRTYHVYDYYNNQNFLRNATTVFNDELLTLSQSIDLIKKSITNEKEDVVFYQSLLNQAPSNHDKDIILGIQADEKKHNVILRQIYFEITGQMVPQDMSTSEVTNNNSYFENLQQALFGELNAVKKYRKIMATMPSGSNYTLLMSIMTDEIRHAGLYNYLITMNK